MKYFWVYTSGLFFLGLTTLGNAAAVEPVPPAPQITAIRPIDDTLYAGETNTPLFLRMERLTRDNIPLWQQYSNVQGDKEEYKDLSTSLAEQGHPLPFCPLAGSIFFKNAIQAVGSANGELDYGAEVWISYITSNPHPEHIPASMADYTYKDLREFMLENKPLNSFAKHIKMFVSVTFHPQGILSSHAGIARTLESFKSKSIKKISLLLHSFAANVTQLRHPKGQFMIVAPEREMATILYKALSPGTLFRGTKEMLPFVQALKEVQEEHGSTYEAPNDILEYDDFIEFWINHQQDLLKKLEAYYPATDPSILEYELRQFLLRDTPSSHYQKAKDFPPIISAEGYFAVAWYRMKIFRPGSDEVISTATREDGTHNWLFREPWIPSGSTCYQAITLEALANLAIHKAP